jgi:C4-type Zn-finger protein
MKCEICGKKIKYEEPYWLIPVNENVKITFCWNCFFKALFVIKNHGEELLKRLKLKNKSQNE